MRAIMSNNQKPQSPPRPITPNKDRGLQPAKNPPPMPSVTPPKR